MYAMKYYSDIKKKKKQKKLLSFVICEWNCGRDYTKWNKSGGERNTGWSHLWNIKKQSKGMDKTVPRQTVEL